MTRAQLFAEMDVAMGGRVAEEITYGLDKVTTGKHGKQFLTSATEQGINAVSTYVPRMVE